MTADGNVIEWVEVHEGDEMKLTSSMQTSEAVK